MTHIFNEEIKIAHVDEAETPINVAIPATIGLDEKGLLQELLTEIRITNLYLSLMTGETIKEEDIC
jgi:hypothetical protein